MSPKREPALAGVGRQRIMRDVVRWRMDKLVEKLGADLLDEYQKFGRITITQLRIEKPDQFLRLVADYAKYSRLVDENTGVPSSITVQWLNVPGPAVRRDGDGAVRLIEQEAAQPDDNDAPPPAS